MFPTRIWGSFGCAPRGITSSAELCHLGYQVRPPHLSEATSPFRSDPFLSIVGDFHLHDTGQLRNALGVSNEGVATHTDADLVLHSYRKWGRDCVDYLHGDFSFGLWDERAKRLFISRDHLGSRPLFYWQDSGRFAFASDPLVLLEWFGAKRELNRRKLAALAIPHGWEFHQDETLHAGILSLRPASWLTVTAEGSEHRIYWKPEINPDLIPAREDDAFEMARELLFSAVRNRIRSRKKVAVYLSGGLDSSAIAAVTARCLAAENRELLAIAAVLPDSSTKSIRDEREFIHEFRSWPNINIHLVTAEGRGPFDYLDDPGEFQACFGTSTRRYLESAIAEAAAQGGANVVLDGLYGELGATATGRGHYADLFVSGRWTRLAHELSAFSSVPDKVPRPLGALRSLAGEFADLIRPYRDWGRGAIFFLQPEFERECQAYSLLKRTWKNQASRQLEWLDLALRRHATRHLTCAQTRIDILSPLFDRRLLEFCLAAPGNMKVRNGYSRYLLRRALDGMLPQKNQWRTTKTPFSPDSFMRFEAQRPRAQEFLAGIGRHDPVRSIVDVDRMSRLLNSFDAAAPDDDTLAIPMSCYLILFLRQFSEFRN